MIKHEIEANGTEIWLKNNLLYNKNGPAIIYSDGFEHWLTPWLNSNINHRIDGPAEIWPDGNEFWSNNGKSIDINDTEKYKKDHVLKHRKKVR